MLKGGTNYTMIRRAISGKVHGHGVKEIWLPAKHTGVAHKSLFVVFASTDSVLNTEVPQITPRLERARPFPSKKTQVAISPTDISRKKGPRQIFHRITNAS